MLAVFRGVVVTVILVCFFSFEMGVAVVLSFGIWKESMSGWGWMKTFSTISMLQEQRGQNEDDRQEMR